MFRITKNKIKKIMKDRDDKIARLKKVEIELNEKVKNRQDWVNFLSEENKSYKARLRVYEERAIKDKKELDNLRLEVSELAIKCAQL